VAKKPIVVGADQAKLQKRPRGTGASFVYDRLRSEILNLELDPGTLLDETELSRRYDISRSPVREALIRLSAEGLVRTLRNRSSIVSFLDVSEILGFFDSLDLMYRVTARRAAISATPAGIMRIKAAAELHSEAINRGTVLDLISTNHGFHMAIARASGNPYYEAWTKGLMDSGQRILRLYMRNQGDHPDAESEGEHPAIVAAIEAHNADAAEAAAGRDAAITSAEIMALLSDRRDSDLAVASPLVERMLGASKAAALAARRKAG
jgi:DNA-binding GntR family transcriptional regulator